MMGWKFDILKKGVANNQTAANNAVRENLAAHGDDGSAMRHVLHYAYPEVGADLSLRPQMRANLEARGLLVSDAASNDGFVLEHHRAVKGRDFDAFTEELDSWFARHGWDYDGWECAIVKGGLN